MGTVEEGGKVATSVIDALKVQPTTLALILINIMFVGVMFWQERETNSRKDKLITELTQIVALCPAAIQNKRDNQQY